MRKELSIVMPAKNEERRIVETLGSYGKFFDGKNAEILVVVNDSSDNTSSIVKSFSQKYPFITLIETKYATGKGGAVAMGFGLAEGEFIGFTDANGSTTSQEFYRLFKLLKDTPQIDGVIGSRFLSNSKIVNAISFRRRLLSRVYNFMVRILFGLDYKDTQCGVKIFRKAAAKSVSTKLSNTGWTFDVNVLLVCRHLNLKILEVATVWSEKAGSQLNLKKALISVPSELLSLKVLEVREWAEKAGLRISKHKTVQTGRKNILIFAWRDIKHPEAGGSEVYVHQTANRLAKTANVTLFTSRPGNLDDRDEIDGVKIIRKGGFLTVYFWAFVYYMLYFRKDMDCVINVQNGIPFFTPLYSNKKLVLIVHHVHKEQWFIQFPYPVALLGYFIESYIMPLVYKGVSVVTVSPSSIKSMKMLGFDDRKIFLAYNAIPTTKKVKVVKAKFPMLLYLGRIKKYKRIDLALLAVKELSRNHKAAKLVIAGTGDDEARLKELTKELDIEKFVEYKGFVSEKEKQVLMSQAWAFLMPSCREGWGITVIEANFYGTPSFGFDVDGVRDSIRDSYSGFLALDQSEFVANIEKVINNPFLRRDLGKTAVKWASNFSWDATADVVKTVIDSDKSPSLVANRTYPWSLSFSTYFI